MALNIGNIKVRTKERIQTKLKYRVSTRQTKTIYQEKLNKDEA